MINYELTRKMCVHGGRNVVTFYRFLTFFVRLLIGVLGALCLP